MRYSDTIECHRLKSKTMYEASQRFSSEEGDETCEYSSPDKISLTQGHGVDVECKGHGTISDQRRFGPPLGRGMNQSEIARQPDDTPGNCDGHPEAQLSLNRGKPRQNCTQKGVPPQMVPRPGKFTLIFVTSQLCQLVVMMTRVTQGVGTMSRCKKKGPRI